MTAAAITAGIVAPGPAWRSLLWLIPLTVLWIVLIYWQPFIPASGVPTSAHQLMAHGVIAVGLWLGLESTDLTPSQRCTTWLAVMIPDTLWFAVAWSAAINGVFSHGRLTVTVAAVGDLPAGDHRRAAVAVVEACGAGARRDAGDAGSSLFSFTAYSAAGLSLPG